IMYMAEKLDAGDILTQVKVPIDMKDHVGTLHDKLSEAGAQLLIETLPQLFANQIEPVKQDDQQATFAANIKREQEINELHKSNVEIYNQLRGLHPWPDGFTTYHDNAVKIWWAEMDDTEYS